MTADEIKEYCKARLQEIEYINHVSHTPSAMVALAAFVGYLSRLAFWGRPQIPNITHGNGLIDKDVDAFNAFIEYFLPKYKQYYDPSQSGRPQSYWLYKVLRCGLVHSMSFYDSWNPNSQNQPLLSSTKPHVVISHNSNYSSPTGPMPYTENGANAIIINAFDLCTDLRGAIEQMFNDVDVRSNAEKFVKYQPTIRDLYNGDTSSCANSPNSTQISSSLTMPAQPTMPTSVISSVSSNANPGSPNQLSC